MEKVHGGNVKDGDHDYSVVAFDRGAVGFSASASGIHAMCTYLSFSVEAARAIAANLIAAADALEAAK